MSCFGNIAFVGLLATSLLGCASSRTVEVQALQERLAKSMVRADEWVHKAVESQREKTELLTGLSRSAGRNYKTYETEIQHRYSRMADLLSAMQEQFKIMTVANKDLSSTGYGRTVVRADESEYEVIAEARDRFDNADAELRQRTGDFGRENQSLTDFIEEKKLISSIDVDDFQRRVQTAIQTAQGEQEDMRQALSDLHALLQSEKNKTRARALSAYVNDLEKLAGEHTELAQGLAPLSADMRAVTLGGAKISSLDSAWPKVNRINSSLEERLAKLKLTSESFRAKAASRSP